MPLPMYPASSDPQIKNCIAIAAGKGGVGKSTVTVQLALALQKAGFKVGVMDTDVYGPSIRKMLPEVRLPSQQGQTFIPADCNGIKMISMAYFRKENEAAAIRAPIANGIIAQFIKNVAWGPLDYLLIDFPPGTGDIQLTLGQQAALTGAILVTTPQEVALIDVRKALHLFHQVRVPIIGIVENMAYFTESTGKRVFPFGQGGGHRLSLETGIPLVGQIPLDPLLCTAGDEGYSIFDRKETANSPTVEAFLHLVEQVKLQAACLKEEGVGATLELQWQQMQAPFAVTPHRASPALKPVFARDLKQISNTHFSIQWNDGVEQTFQLAQLQNHCPCAQCVDEATGQRLSQAPHVNEDVGATTIKSVGRYALRVYFTSGCSNGIYSYDFLRNM